tara:strand:- start:340 stop:699 length:360 start_codon:yes stop_codon:yes gene_type:complete
MEVKGLWIICDKTRTNHLRNGPHGEEGHLDLKGDEAPSGVLVGGACERGRKHLVGITSPGEDAVTIRKVIARGEDIKTTKEYQERRNAIEHICCSAGDVQHLCVREDHSLIEIEELEVS